MDALLNFVNVQCLYRDLVLTLRAPEMESGTLDAIDVLGPRVDERDVVAGAGEVPADITANRACADECDTSFSHGSLGAKAAHGRAAGRPHGPCNGFMSGARSLSSSMPNALIADASTMK